MGDVVRHLLLLLSNATSRLYKFVYWYSTALFLILIAHVFVHPFAVSSDFIPFIFVFGCDPKVKQTGNGQGENHHVRQ